MVISSNCILESPRECLKITSACTRMFLAILMCKHGCINTERKWKRSRSVVSDSLRPWDFPGKNTGVGYHFLLQGIFPTQGSNPGLLHCRQTLYRLSHMGSPIDWEALIQSVSQSVQLLSHVRLFATPWIAACQASLSITISRGSLKLMSIKSVMPSSYLILCRPLFLLPPISPSIRVKLQL